MWLLSLSFHRKNCYLSSVITHPKICFFIIVFFVIEILELHSFVGGYVMCVCVPSQFNEMATVSFRNLAAECGSCPQILFLLI
jgi:hypothetical protein